MIPHPIFQSEIPSFTQTPPYLITEFTNPKTQRTSQSEPLKAKPKPLAKETNSSQNFRIRRSQRLISRFGTKKPPTIDNTVYEILDSDEDTSHVAKPSIVVSKSALNTPPKKAPSKSPSKEETSKTVPPQNAPQKCLFIVQKTLVPQNMVGDLFEVLCLIDDEEAIRCHQACGDNYTPIKVCRIYAIYV